MIHERLASLSSVIVPAVADRLVLLVNHIVASEAIALERLRRHSGRRLVVEVAGVPPWLPGLAPLILAVTPAGLFERLDGPRSDTGLTVRLDLSQPWCVAARVLTGERPAIDVQGDAAFATDINWLVEHLRWDIEADLEPLVGPATAHGLARAGSALSAGIGQGLRALASLRAQ
jgi:ubiquinone biosynthesis protein UbiJ